jgi:hypothetical protein
MSMLRGVAEVASDGGVDDVVEMRLSQRLRGSREGMPVLFLPPKFCGCEAAAGCAWHPLTKISGAWAFIAGSFKKCPWDGGGAPSPPRLLHSYATAALYDDS